MAGLDDAYEQWNKEARKWARATSRSLATRAPQASGQLRGSLKPKVYTNSYAIEAIRFSLARQGIFVGLGVGGGRPVGSAAAQQAAQDWINPTLSARLSQLNSLIDQYYGDATAKAMASLLPASITFKNR